MPNQEQQQAPFAGRGTLSNSDDATLVVVVTNTVTETDQVLSASQPAAKYSGDGQEFFASSRQANLPGATFSRPRTVRAVRSDGKGSRNCFFFSFRSEQDQNPEYLKENSSFFLPDVPVPRSLENCPPEVRAPAKRFV